MTDVYSTTRSQTTSSAYNNSVARSSSTELTLSHDISDDGLGGFLETPVLGTIDYIGGEFTLKVESDYFQTNYQSNYERASSFDSAVSHSGGGGSGNSSSSNSGDNRGGQYLNVAQTETLAGGTVTVDYRPQGASVESKTFDFDTPPITINLTPYTLNSIVPNSVQFTWHDQTFRDFDGFVYYGGSATVPGTLAGSIDYKSGLCIMDNYPNGTGNFVLQSLWTRKGNWSASVVYFRTPGSPIKPGGFILTVLDMAGTQLNATANVNGDITGDHCYGTIDYLQGIVQMLFGDKVLDSGLTSAEKAEWWYNTADIGVDGKIFKPWPVDLSTMRYSIVAYSLLPLSAEILGLDTVRLPQDGRVPIFQKGSVIVIHNTITTTFDNPVTAGQVIDLGRTLLSEAIVWDANDLLIPSTLFTADLDLGTITMANPLNLTGYAQPLKCEHRVEDMSLCTDVQITGELGLLAGVNKNYALGTTFVSTALISGDLFAHVSTLFEQSSWTTVWQDTLIGTRPNAQYNSTYYPIQVLNNGCVQERWVIIFTGATSFACYGETLGFVGNGSTNAEFSPVNLKTGQPYFTIPLLGWGGGWATTNCLRFNTNAANFPIWFIRTTLQGLSDITDDNFKAMIRGDAN